MQPLDKKYKTKLEAIAKEIQGSEELAKYLEEEEESDFLLLKEAYEPQIGLLYDKVAADDPLQLVAFEKRLLEPDFEGLYLPKILGYSVLRGEIDDNYKYVRPQSHFKEILLAICNSANFDILKKRIGQTIQMGFALSSDIWITNLIAPFQNRRIRYYLQGQSLEKYRDPKKKAVGYQRYRRQFRNHNFMTADFPQTMSDLKILWSPLKNFLIYRINLGGNDKSIVPHLKKFIENQAFQGTMEHLQILGLYAGFFDLGKADLAHVEKIFNATRAATAGFAENWLHFVLEIHEKELLDMDGKVDGRISSILDKSVKDELTEFYLLTDLVHSKGYTDEGAQEAVKVFYNHHEGLSLLNECIRKTIFNYFARLLDNLEEKDYPEFFEFSKSFAVYQGIFSNQQFNQDIKDKSMAYVKKLLLHFTDKRGKDYQDIKKFVATTFQDLGFLKEKEVLELFKTRRKRRQTA